SLFGQTKLGIIPPNFKEKVPKTTTFYRTETVNNELERQNAQTIRTESLDKMMRFGKELSSNIDFISAADKFVQPHGRTLYQYGIISKNALSINLILEQFHLAEGAHLFMTDEKSGKFIGAYTSDNNNVAQTLGTELLNTDEVVLVLDEPANANTPSHFTITQIVHGFEDLEVLAKGLNTSGDCHYDVNCSIGSGYELQRNSVAMMVSGGGFCTGSLVNNTSGNIIPYIISAKHCGTNPTSWVFRFRWEAPVGQTSCATNSPSGNGITTYNINGAQLKAFNTNSDFVLVKLNSNPDPNWGIYYNGWDNTDSSTASLGIGIHHPDGDIKKISINTDALPQQTISFLSTQNHAWVINNWEFGATEPGSSGSPLFNQEKRLIGVLSGGTAACAGTSPNDQSDFYGRFGYGWNNSINANARLKDWLDSSNTGATVIDGVDPAIGYDLVDASLSTLYGAPASRCDSVANLSFQLINSGLNNLTQVDFVFGFNGLYNNNYTWTGNLSTYGSTIISLPSFTIPLGQNAFSLKVSNSNGAVDLNIDNNYLNIPMYRLQNDFTAKLALDLDCYGTETSWDLRDDIGNIVYSSEPYPDSVEGLYEYEFCLSYGCYKFTIYDQYGDGMSGCSVNEGGNGSYVLSNIATGYVYSQLSENDANFGNSYIDSFCVYSTTSLTEYDLGNIISLFPNPGSEKMTIKTGGFELNEVTVYSYTGQEVFNGNYTGNSTTLDTENWPSSVYLVKIKTDKGELMKRWIKK
ncbi:MAG: T9SS type A sorting domain-containing protein, partial [Bacteroidota bacterium]